MTVTPGQREYLARSKSNPQTGQDTSTRLDSFHQAGPHAVKTPQPITHTRCTNTSLLTTGNLTEKLWITLSQRRQVFDPLVHISELLLSNTVAD